ncbi:MAG: tyrosine recombinase XerC [Ruminococcaceae bacterium]|nr:tyrosine recombinase XerC [Oscillospiraceae bacterium]
MPVKIQQCHLYTITQGRCFVSTYISPTNPKKHGNYDDCPPAVVDYLRYSETIRGLSPRTVNGYYIDLRTFFKFLFVHRGIVAADIHMDDVDISGADLAFIKQIDRAEIYDFLYYVTRERENAPATRARKLSSLKGFFKYMTSKTNQLEQNPADDIDRPAQKKRLPKYLTLDESISLLSNIQSDFFERDYCIITLFLNCGMRLSELVLLNLSDIKNDTLRLIGKGNKERIVYLNGACQDALDTLIAERAKLSSIKDTKALFLSRKTGKRLSARRVQQIVNTCLQSAGLDGKGYSVHKLRHTAATLMYQHGQVDLLSLKEVLGHVNVATTQIYTHLDGIELRKAAQASPLAKMKVEKPIPNHENPESSANGDDVENMVENVDNAETDL